MGAFVFARYCQQRWKLSDGKSIDGSVASGLTLFEFLRSYLFTGFPWLSVGYAHAASPLSGYAPIFGVYGLGGIAALCAAGLV